MLGRVYRQAVVVEHYQRDDLMTLAGSKMALEQRHDGSLARPLVGLRPFDGHQETAASSSRGLCHSRYDRCVAGTRVTGHCVSERSFLWSAA